MLHHLKKLLNNSQNSENRPPHDLHLSSAVIFLETAFADDHCSPQEMDHILDTIQKNLNLSHGEALDLVELANHAREHEVDLWGFTNRLNAELTTEKKIEIIETVWEIIFLDGHLESHEDYFAHKLAKLLRLTHKEMIDAKMRVKGKITGVSRVL